MVRQDPGLHRAHLKREAKQEPVRDEAGADRGVRAGHALELPAHDVVLEDGRVSGGRKHGSHQAGAGLPAHGAQIRGVGAQVSKS